MGPRVATLVAATMHGGTPQCLRGFGYRAARGEPDVCGDGNAAPPFEKAQQRSALSPENNDGGAKEVPSRPVSATGKRSSRANSGNNTQRVSLSASTRQSLSGLQRTSALASPSSRNTVVGSKSATTFSGAAGVGVVGSGSSESLILSTSGAPTTAAAAFEEDLGRPQTAGTASG